MFPAEDWSESWSLEAGTLQVEMSIAICGQDGKEISARWSQFQVEMARNHWFVGGNVIYRWWGFRISSLKFLGASLVPEHIGFRPHAANHGAWWVTYSLSLAMCPKRYPPVIKPGNWESTSSMGVSIGKSIVNVVIDRKINCKCVIWVPH